MMEEITKINQDEYVEDFPFSSEDEASKDKTEEGFIPTYDELIALVKYWSLRILESRWLFDFTYPTAGSDIQAEMALADGRINRIRKIVGDTKVDKACEEVRNDFREAMRDDPWAVFERGDRNEQPKA
jgi:hypothetical protein